MKLRKRLAKRLKEIRGEQTQAQFSRKIGIGQASLNRLLNGEQAETMDMIKTISKSLCIDVAELLKKD